MVSGIPGTVHNDTPVRDETGTVGLDDLSVGGAIKISAGRKRHALVRPV